MKNKYTEIAKKAINNSIRASSRFGHSYVGCHHLLLAMAEESDSKAYEMLCALGINSEKIRNAIIDIYGWAEQTQLTNEHITPMLKKLLSRALEISEQEKEEKVNTRHILLAIYEEENSALKVLRRIGCVKDAHDNMMLYLFGTNFGCDINGYPIQEIVDDSAKDFERAIGYMPEFLDYLIKEHKLHCFGIGTLLDRMVREGYSSEQIEAFVGTWIAVLEEKNTVCTDIMDIYLYGRYTYDVTSCGELPVKREVSFEDKRSFEKAKAYIPAYVMWLAEIYSDECRDFREQYDPDARLKYVLGSMKKFGYSYSEISEFANLWVEELMKVCDVFYSLMYLYLFGEHFSGESIDIDVDFDAALDLIPDYLELLFDYRGEGDEYSRVFDTDQQLFGFVADMMGCNYSDYEIDTFVMRWVRATIDSGRPCNSPMYAYLFGRFIFKHESMEMSLTEDLRSFESALEFIPSWIMFLTNESINYYKGYSPCDIIDLIFKMYEEGYGEDKIEMLFSRFLETLNSYSPFDVEDVMQSLVSEAEDNPWLDGCVALLDNYAAYGEDEDSETALSWGEI